VRAANTHKVALYPISTGNNIGLGSRSASASGQVVVDLGRKMNRILDIDEKLAFAVVEPGVSYQALYDELVRRGNKLMLDVTSGPPQGGMIGNALDKGAGYSPYFDHFGFSCGLEIVLGNGELLRTGDGALDSKDLINWHTSKYSFGPILDGLFTQSNFGIVTRMGVWLLPRPPAVRSFHFAFPDDDDLETIVELCRPLKLSNFVPTLFRVSNDLYLCGSEGESPEYRASGGKRSISDEAAVICANATGWAPGMSPAHFTDRVRRRWSRKSSGCVTCSGKAARLVISRTRMRRRSRRYRSRSTPFRACRAWASSGC
jgi:4-cresol dehydrogenase (hydroxylating) flavoprotein subunit